MKNIVELYLFQVLDILRTEVVPTRYMELTIPLTAGFLLENKMNKGDQVVLSQVNGDYRLISAKNKQEALDTIDHFISNNPNLSWLKGCKEAVLEISDIVFNSLKGLWNQTAVENEAEFFAQLVEVLVLRDKNAGLFISTPSINQFVKALLAGTDYKTLYDPTIGSGLLAYEVSKNHEGVEVYGQEMDEKTLMIAQIQFALTGRITKDVDLKSGDVIVEPAHQQKFDCVISHPPFGVRDWGADKVGEDSRFTRGIPSRTNGDYAFITQVVESLNEHGKGIIITTQGALFREGAEGAIRQKLIEENRLEAVIVLPSNMLYGTNVAINLLIFNHQRQQEGVFLMDATPFVTKNRQLNTLSDEAIKEMVQIYTTREERDQISKLLSSDEIEKNQFNLSASRYLTPQLELEVYDKSALKAEFNTLKSKFLELQVQLDEILD